jgi:hypothetical protein
MSLTISGNYNSFPLPTVNSVASLYARGKGARIDGCSNGGANDAGNDAVLISAKGRAASSRLLSEDLILPTEANVRSLSATLSGDLGRFFSESGVSSEPPIKMDVDWNTGNIGVKGDRADKEKIQDLINGNEAIKEEIRNLAAIGSHAAGMADSLKFEEEYLASSNPESVVAKYSSLFGLHRQSHAISIQFDGSSIQVMSDGQNWISSGA